MERKWKQGGERDNETREKRAKKITGEEEAKQRKKWQREEGENEKQGLYDYKNGGRAFFYVEGSAHELANVITTPSLREGSACMIS
jgi:hypothetical protein